MAKRPTSQPVAGGACESPLSSVEPTAESLDLAKAFAAVGDPVRIQMLALIAEAGELCVCDLLEPLGRKQATVSHHIRLLFDAGLLDREKRGSWTWYRVVPERVDELHVQLRSLVAVPAGTTTTR
jgi:ArsR family transcriptional regulator